TSPGRGGTGPCGCWSPSAGRSSRRPASASALAPGPVGEATGGCRIPARSLEGVGRAYGGCRCGRPRDAVLARIGAGQDEQRIGDRTFVTVRRAVAHPAVDPDGRGPAAVEVQRPVRAQVDEELREFGQGLPALQTRLP